MITPSVNDVDFDARQDVPYYEPSTWILRRPDAPELDADRILATYRHATRDALREMRYETPRLTAINVIYDIVQALREKYRSE